MDVVFNCPKCEQELAVDSTGAGSEINCPSCGELITIPEPETVVPRSGEQAAGVPRVAPHPINPIASSAAAKIELHLKVPTDRAGGEILITKPLAPLETAPKAGEGRIRVKTIRHIDCMEVGHDKFDEIVTKFLLKIGEDAIINMSTLSYSFLDIGSQKLLMDYGLLIVYRA